VTVFFAPLGSVRIKGARKMLMKLIKRKKTLIFLLSFYLSSADAKTAVNSSMFYARFFLYKILAPKIIKPKGN